MMIFYDLKRIFAKRAMIFLCLFAPTAVLLLFSAVFAPLVVTSGELKFSIAICNEDDSETSKVFINQYVNSQAIRGVITPYFTDTVETAEALLQNGDVSVVIHIPEGMYRSIETGNPKPVRIISTRMHALEVSVIDMTLSSSLSVVSQSQNVLAAASDVLIAHDVPEADADAFFDGTIEEAIDCFMNRRTIIGDVGVASTLDNYLPVEYYTGAIFAVFAALSMLPLIRITASDASGPVLKRGLLAGRSSMRFFVMRVAAGTVLVLLVLCMLPPAMLALRGAGSLIGDFSGSVPALIVTILLSALCFSAFAAAIGFWLSKEQAAVWLGFYFVFFMAVCCGALLPVGSLPPVLAEAGKWMPLRPVMRMLSASLFRMEAAYYADLLKLLGFTAAALLAGALGAWKRGRA